MARGSENGDMNKGSGGEYIYLYYNKSKQSGHTGYTELDIMYGEGSLPPVGWERVSADLNKTAGNEDVYLIAKRAPVP